MMVFKAETVDINII